MSFFFENVRQKWMLLTHQNYSLEYTRRQIRLYLRVTFVYGTKNTKQVSLCQSEWYD